MTAPHLPDDLHGPPRHRGVVPLGLDLGTVAGHRLVLLSLEVWTDWADLRFARIDVGAERPLPRRVPPLDAWRIAADGRALEVLDVVGRGDRSFSNGEVRMRPVPAGGATLSVEVDLVSGAPALHAEVTVRDLPE